MMMAGPMSQLTYQQILLTGATGALGPALAAELARSGAAERIAVLMRAPAGELDKRFAGWQNDVRDLLPLDEKSKADCLFAVGGDICQEGLGMSHAAKVQRETDLVVHAAADTNFAAAQDKQWDVNVEGTRRTLQWAEACPHFKRFLLVSSAFVSGSRVGPIDETLTHDAPEFVTYYQRTKWEAEHVALRSGLPLGIARVSLVLGAHADGSVHRPGAIHSLIKWFSRGLVPMMPGLPDATADVIATELAAQCLVRAVRAEWRSGQPPIWHFAAGPKAPRMSELIDEVYQHFAQRPQWRRRNIPRPQMVQMGEFSKFIDAVDAAGRTVLAQAMRSVNTFLPDMFYPKTYVTAQAEALWGGPLPQYDWRETMGRVIRFCCPMDK